VGIVTAMMTMVKAAVDNLEGLVGAMVQPVCVPNDTASFSCSKMFFVPKHAF
jgi:hypothetical protein